MRLFCATWIIILVMLPAFAQDVDTADNVPYIYYYSNVLNGIVIERVDGTDSRIIGQGLMPESATVVDGPGWSPDGRWFVWRGYQPLEFGFYMPQGSYGVSIENQSLDILAEFPVTIDALQWHPTENLLLVYGWDGGRNEASGTNIATYWLIDVDTQDLLVSMSIESYPEGGPFVYWVEDYLTFYETPWQFDRFYIVTMHYDGDVDIDRISREEWLENQRDEHNTGLSIYGAYPQFTQLSYSYSNPQDLSFVPPNNTGAAGSYRSWRWHEQNEWILIGYEVCFAGCSGISRRVSVYHPTTEQYREISDCGTAYGCVSWLPESVDITQLTEGHSESVLVGPSYYFDVDRDHYPYFGPSVTLTGQHTLDCNTNEMPYRRELVRNRETGDVDFILQNAESCDQAIENINYESQYHVVFALSPNNKYYAITRDNLFTSVHYVETGEQIAILNIEGGYLRFSQDSQTLFTHGNFRGSAWDMRELIGHDIN